MRILFIGSTRRGYLALKALLEAGKNVVGVLSMEQNAHEIERFEGAFRDLAAQYRLPLRETRFVRDPALVEWARDEIGAEVAFAVGVRVMLPETFYALFPKHCWAVHDSLLPKYRGFAPLNWALINGDTKTGVSMLKVAAEMDAGPILLQKEVSIGADETAPQLYEKICAASVAIVLEACDTLGQGTAPYEQEHEAATFACSRSPEDGLIDWTASTQSIFNLIRGLTFPYPGAFTFYRSQKLIILSANILQVPPRYEGRIAGRIVQLLAGGKVDVLTGDGVLRIREICIDGTTRQAAGSFLKSVRSSLGLPLPSFPSVVSH